MKKKLIIVISILAILIIIMILFKDYFFSCRWCASDNKIFITEVRYIMQNAENKNKLDGTTLFCKDSEENDLFNLTERKDVNYYIEFDNDKIIKTIIKDTKNQLAIKEDNIDGININEISENNYYNYDETEIKCN